LVIKVFATSDQHFYHRNIIKYTDRPFDINDEFCVEENALLMIEKYNKIVSPEDIVIFGGDIICSRNLQKEKVQNIISQLKGRKILIKGNHDDLTNKDYLDIGFEKVFTFIHIGNYFISHYPCYISEWTTGIERSQIKQIKKLKCDTVIHGHVHNKDPEIWEPDGLKRINVSVDFKPNDFYPVDISYPEVIEYFKNMK